MSVNTLARWVDLLPSDRLLVVSDDVATNAEQLSKKAMAFRDAHFSDCRGATVAVQIALAESFISALVALDGWVDTLVVLPNDLPDEQVDDFLSRVNADAIFDGCRLRNIGKRCDEKPFDGETKWLLATSGTTGTPKLITHTLNSLTRTTLTNSEKGALYCWGLTYDPARFAGLQVVLQSILSGATLVVPPNDVSFDDMMTFFAQKGVNALSATPSWWRKVLMSDASLSLKLSRITLGGEIAEQSVLDQLGKRYPSAKKIHVYASTEAGVGFSVKDGQAGFPADWLAENKLGIDLRISDENHLLIKSGVSASGEEISSRLSVDGYLDTEDLVELCGERVIFRGRASGAINIGGNKVHPEEVEDVIRAVEGVSDAMVVGKANPIMGQIIEAHVVLSSSNIATDDKKQLKKLIQVACKENLAEYKVPAIIKFVDSLTYSAAGKLKRI